MNSKLELIEMLEECNYRYNSIEKIDEKSAIRAMLIKSRMRDILSLLLIDKMSCSETSNYLKDNIAFEEIIDYILENRDIPEVI